jgi:3-oxoacyl-[acyl-carrier protein] reductase
MAEDRPAALVTGSASGIGRAAALRLARAGNDVAINYRRSEDSARRTMTGRDRR